MEIQKSESTKNSKCTIVYYILPSFILLGFILNWIKFVGPFVEMKRLKLDTETHTNLKVKYNCKINEIRIYNVITLFSCFFFLVEARILLMNYK